MSRTRLQHDVVWPGLRKDSRECRKIGGRGELLKPDLVFAPDRMGWQLLNQETQGGDVVQPHRSERPQKVAGHPCFEEIIRIALCPAALSRVSSMAALHCVEERHLRKRSTGDLKRDFVDDLIKAGVERGEKIGHALLLMLMRTTASPSPSGPAARSLELR
jgi:hypothetical protein